MKDMNEIEDGKITVVGADLKDVEAAAKIPLAIYVEVAGRKMQEDFEPILERQIHHLINYAQGTMHIGQRDIAWVRVAKQAVEKGFGLKHIGSILHAKFHQDFGNILDKVQVTIYTDQAKVEEITAEAREIYKTRDERVEGMTDEGTETYYSCTLCQSFAPTHVCMISPERTGLCGAYNWLDCKASFEINPTGPNQPVEKGKCVDERLGRFEGIDRLRPEGLPPEDRGIQPLQHHGRADDHLRVLRVHRRCAAHVQRDHDRGPRLQGRDPVRHEVHHPGRHHRRWRELPGIRGTQQVLHHPEEVHQGGRRASPDDLDAQAPEGRDRGSAQEGWPKSWAFRTSRTRSRTRP